MKKAKILLAALAFAALTASAAAQTAPVAAQAGTAPAMRATEPDSDGAPLRSARDNFFPDYSVAHRPPVQLQPQPARPQQQPEPPAQASGNSWSPPAATQAPPQAAPSTQTEKPETVVVTAAASQPTTYRLGTGDKVRVTVFGEDDLSGEFVLDGSGFISMPLIGQVQANGLSTDELARSITAKLEDGYLNEPRVSVSVSTYRPFYIIGQVNKPGEYPYVNDMTVLNAVALAGGYTDYANESTVYVRANGETEEHAMRADSTSRIHPGDVVRVPKSAFSAVISVLGPLAGIIGLSYGYTGIH